MNNSMFDAIKGLLHTSPLSDNPNIKELRASIILFYQTHQYEFNRKPITLERIAHVILDETLKSNAEHETNFQEVAQKFVQNSKVEGDLCIPPTSRLDDRMTDEEKNSLAI